MPTYVQPLLVSRLAPAAVCGYWCVGAWREPWALAARLAAVAALGTLAVRCLRVGVVIEPKRVVVRGYLWTRRIPRHAVEDVTEFPSLVWRTPGARRRKTPVLSLMTAPMTLPWIDARHEERAAYLRRVLGRKRKRR